MGKSKGPRVKSRLEPTAPPAPDRAKPQNRFIRYWKFFWAIVGPIVTALVTAASFRPDLSITTSANIDPAQTFGMQFAVTNTGKVPVRNLRFSCGLRGRTVYIGSLRIGNISPADYLPRGQTITRTCFNESNDVTDATLVVTVHFDWPVLPVSEAKDVSFVPVRTTNGFVMVPDYQNN